VKHRTGKIKEENLYHFNLHNIVRVSNILAQRNRSAELNTHSTREIISPEAEYIEQAISRSPDKPTSPGGSGRRGMSTVERSNLLG